MKLNWNFLGGRGVQNNKKKNLPWGEYGYFLELHNGIPSSDFKVTEQKTASQEIAG